MCPSKKKQLREREYIRKILEAHNEVFRCD